MRVRTAVLARMIVRSGFAGALAGLLALAPASAFAQQRAPEAARTYSHADSLRGGNGPGRAWWDATYYDLNVAITPADSSIRGWNAITYKVLSASKPMQVDLQPPLVVDSIRQDGRDVKYTRVESGDHANAPTPVECLASGDSFISAKS